MEIAGRVCLAVSVAMLALFVAVPNSTHGQGPKQGCTGTAPCCTGNNKANCLSCGSSSCPLGSGCLLNNTGGPVATCQSGGTGCANTTPFPCLGDCSPSGPTGCRCTYIKQCP
jgi:hypothetical protein